MNVKNLIAVAAVLAAGSAFAADPASQATQGKTRAEVRAELERDYAQGITAMNRMPEFVDFTQTAINQRGLNQQPVHAQTDAVKGDKSGS